MDWEDAHKRYLYDREEEVYSFIDLLQNGPKHNEDSIHNEE